MKKAISILLVLVMVLGLCACGGEKKPAAAQPKEFRVGFGRVNITPTYSVPLAGYGNSDLRMSEGFLDYLYATCIAITDENDSTVLLITLDGTGMYNNIVPIIREAVTEATGVPAERTMMNVTHVHSGPELSNTNNAAIQRLIPEYAANVAKAAKDAMDDRSPATMETATGYTEDLSFVRHYTTTSGQLYSDNMTLKGSMTGHHHEPDNQIQLIIFRRAAEDKKDIVAMNWQAHIKFDSTNETEEGKLGRSMLTSDGVGAFRTYVESNSDYLLAFYLGASGNINMNSKITTENRTTKSKVFGELMGESILEALKTTTPVEGTEVKLTQRFYDAPIDHSEDHLVAEAQKVSQVWAATNNFTESVNAAPSSGIVSPYHAMSIISRANSAVESRSLELNAIQVGPIGFVTAPYEMFDTNGMFVKENSPYDTTFVLSMCNGANSYIPAAYAYEGTGTYEVHNRLFPVGTAETLADIMVEMLNDLNK